MTINEKNKIGLKIISLVFIVILLVIVFSNKIKITGNATSSFPSGPNLTEDDIKNIWDSIFNENSTGIIYNDTTEDGEQENFVAIKIIDTELFALLYTSIISTKNMSNISAFHINLTKEYIDTIEGQFPSNKSSIEEMIVINEVNDVLNEIAKRSIDNGTHANGEAKNIFKEDLVSGSDFMEENYEYDNVFLLEIESSWMNNPLIEELNSSIMLLSNYTYDVLYLFYAVEDIPECIPNWTKIEGSCMENDTRIIRYEDENYCAISTNRPSDKIERCDYNNNGIIGNSSDIDSSLDLDVYISDLILNTTANYSNNTSLQSVKIKNNGSTIIEFKHNFSNRAIDLSTIEIKIEPSSSKYGYIITNGIDNEKTIYINKKNSSSKLICIYNKSSASLNSFSDDCNETYETLLECPDSSASYPCSVNSNKIKVEKLLHSAVKEIIDTNECIPNWNCSAWSECADGTKNRTCTDKNNCNTNANKPNITETCTVSSTICNPSWECTDWSPIECDGKTNQTRTCTDKNNCNKLDGKPLEVNECEIKNNQSGSKIIFIIIAVIFVMMAISLLVYWILTKNKEEDTSSEYSMEKISNMPKY